MRDLVVSQHLDLGDSARMFALVTMATADSIIASWDTKIHYNVWRPVTAIRQAENDGNPETQPNLTWTPFFNTPNYPDYTSGANNIGAAAASILQHLFGDQTGLHTVQQRRRAPCRGRIRASLTSAATSSTPGSSWGSTSASPTRTPFDKACTSRTGRSAITCVRYGGNRR